MGKIKVNYLLLENVVGALLMRICRKLRCDKKSLTVSVSIETALVTKRILARNCSLSNRAVGCMRVKYLMLLLYAGVMQG